MVLLAPPSMSMQLVSMVSRLEFIWIRLLF